MSVIAIKDKNTVYIGCDSIYKEFAFKYFTKCKENFSIFPMKNAKNVLIGHYGRDRECDWIKTAKLVPEGTKGKDISYDDVVRIIVPNIFKELEEAKYLSEKPFGKDREMSSLFIIATPSKMFTISYDGAVVEFDDYICIGEKTAVMMGNLYTTVGANPKDRILSAFAVLSKTGVNAGFPVVISDTTSMEFEVIE